MCGDRTSSWGGARGGAEGVALYLLCPLCSCWDSASKTHPLWASTEQNIPGAESECPDDLLLF